MANAPKTLDTTIRYRFENGDIESFQGKSCYRLSNSWRDAVRQAKKACVAKNERFDVKRIVINDQPVDAIECRYCLKFIPRDREDVSPFCSEECREEWEANNTD